MKKKVDKKRRRRCCECKQLRHDVRTVEDPFMKDVWNKTVIKPMCEPCVQQSAESI